MTSYLYQLAASVESVSGVVVWAERAAHAHPHLPPASVNVLLVCLQELVANVALHARRDDGKPTVKVGLEFEAERIGVLIEDNGHPFDPVNDAPNKVETDLASAGVGGRGVLIVRQLTRAMSYKRVGEWNCVRLDIA